MQKLFSLTRIAKGESTITDMFFSSVEKAKATLSWENENVKSPYGLCECYYDLAVIEEAEFDNNGADWSFQIWYQLQKQENEEYLWIEIPCPKEYERTVCFYSSGK